MTEKQKDYVVRRWNLCESNKKIQLAAEFVNLKQINHRMEIRWWQFLKKRL